jgi:5-methylcytosine-specific restriction endonuclease McrA
MKHKIDVPREKIEEAINATDAMSKAAVYLGINYRTFRRVAMDYGLYKPAPSAWQKKYELDDILNGKHPQYPTSKLSKRLIKEGLLEYKCNSCGISDWNGIEITLELNHIDGDNRNHQLDNLEMLCPNCHSQTPTYRSKKLKLKK